MPIFSCGLPLRTAGLASLALALGAIISTSSVDSKTMASSSSSSDAVYYHDPLVLEEHEISDASSSGMTNANFVKTSTLSLPASITEADNTALELSLFAPSRVFIDYVDYENGSYLVNSSTYMEINMYGDTAELVGQMGVQTLGNTEDGVFSLIIYGPPDSAATSGDSSSVSSGNLLVVISIFRRNQLRFFVGGDGEDPLGREIVIGDGVLRVQDDSPRLIPVSSGNLEFEGASGSSDFDLRVNSFLATVSGYTALYVLSPSTVLDLDSLYIEVDEKASLYMDVSSIVTSVETSLWTDYGGTIVAIAGTVNTTTLDLKSSFSTGLCLYVTDSLQVGEAELNDDENYIVLPGKTAGIEVEGTYTCGKAVMPERVPRDITLTTTTFTASNETLTVSSASSTADNASSAQSCAMPVLIAMSLLAGSFFH